MMMCRFISLVACLCLLTTAVSGAAFDPLVGGSAKSLNLYVDATTMTERTLLSSDSFRLDLSGELTSMVSFELSLDQRVLWQSRDSTLELSDSFFNRAVDLENVQNQGGKFSGLSQVDRLNIHADFGRSALTLGRQALGFGRITLFSPLDVIAPFAPDALDVDVRPGVDAVKFNHYFGLAGQAGGIAVFGAKRSYHSYLLTAGENVANIDILFIGGQLRGRNMVGVGLAGELGKLGLKAEGSWYRGRDVGQPGGDLRDSFSVAALEGWYRFDMGLILLGEYLYSGFGSETPELYPQVAVSAPLREGLGFLLGRHYLLFGPSYQFHPLITLNGLMIYNLKDDSLMLRPLLALSLADNLQLDLFWSWTRGEGPRVDSVSGEPLLRSEFGSAANSGGLLLRWYF